MDEVRSDWLCSVAALMGADRAQLSCLSGVIEDASCWFDSGDLSGRSIIQIPLEARPQVAAYLARVAGLGRVPLHRHAGRETILVISGAFKVEGQPRIYAAGDMLVSEAGTEHSIVITSEHDCIVAIRIDFTHDAKAHSLDRGIREPLCGSKGSEPAVSS